MDLSFVGPFAHPTFLAGITEALGIGWIDAYFPNLSWGQWLFWFLVLTGVSVGLSGLAVWWVIRELPVDYFANPVETKKKRSFISWLGGNIVGLCVLLIGVVFFFTPGQGLMLIVAGLALTEFPGKHRLERKLARNTKVFSALNWLRNRLGREPFAPLSRVDETATSTVAAQKSESSLATDTKETTEKADTEKADVSHS